MNRQINIAVAVVLCMITCGAVDGLAQQIFNQFHQPELVVGRPYRDLDLCPVSAVNKNVIPPASFVLPPVNTNNLDDGYATVQMPFTFNFNGTSFTHLYVSVNGFVTFDGTKLLPAKQSAGLFINSASFPDNVLAPFWGDHRLRTASEFLQGYMPSEISWAYDVDRDENCDTIQPVRRCMIIQWKNLNINDQSVNSSVGNFQCRIYEGDASTNYQGDIEFAYGQVGGNPHTTNTIVVTRGATVGIKGSGGFPGYLSDFWNGLVWSPQLGANMRTDSTTRWQPSDGRSDAVIRFGSIVYLSFDMWGYGDADTSAARNQRHEGMAQNRRVTANDARVIMRSMVTKKWLDSVWKRQAYQGDVNHSGRYYYTKLTRDFSTDSLDVNGDIVIWRRTIDVDQFTGKQVLRVMHESEGLYGLGGKAPDLSALNQIYYEVTEYDAALIMRYISGRLPYLPWIYDNDTTGPDFGKISGSVAAENIHFGAPAPIGNGMIRVPIYLEHSHAGAFGVRFETNADIVAITPVEAVGTQVGVDNTDRVAVVAGYGSFDSNTPVAYATLKQNPSYTFSSIRFNEESKPNVRLNGSDELATNKVAAFPNPMINGGSIVMDLPESGNYTVAVFDMFGKNVTTLFNGMANSGTMQLNWDGTTQNGELVSPGTYVVRVTGENVLENTKVVIAR